MRKSAGALFLAALIAVLGCQPQSAPVTGKPAVNTSIEHSFAVLDPGHFHAALVFKSAAYPGVDSLVSIYAPVGQDYVDHMARVVPFNTRETDPAGWRYKSYLGPDYETEILNDDWSDIVVLSGRNQPKIDRILACVRHGKNVLADKPWVIEPSKLAVLDTVLAVADSCRLVAYDIMTERHEITTILQRELIQDQTLFGNPQSGTPEQPAVVKKSVHHLFKSVAGRPLIRPWWFFDTAVQGEGLVDVTTHLVDITFWCLFPEQPIDYKTDIQMQDARHWPTLIDREQFGRVTGLTDFPPQLKLDETGKLPYFCNGSMNFSLRGINVLLQVEWNFEAPAGAGDTHFSTVRGSLASVLIEQGPNQNYRPELYVEAAEGIAPEAVGQALETSLARLTGGNYPGLELKKEGARWHILIPDSYRIGHEAHFGQVTKSFLGYLGNGTLPAWERPNMLAKYYVTTSALELARSK